jgi:hemolysin activation/secretion protein
LFIRFIFQEGTEGLGLKLEQIIASSCRQKILLGFSLSFLASYIYVNGTEIHARAEICYVNDTGEHWVNGSWFHPTSNTPWYTLSVAAGIPEDATAVKVVIHGRPDFKAWIDLASLNIEDQ